MSYIINPETNRRCTVGGPKYKDLVKRGLIENLPFGKLDHEMLKSKKERLEQKEKADNVVAEVTEKLGKIDLKRAQSFVDNEEDEFDEAEVRKEANRVLAKYIKLHGKRLEDEIKKHGVKSADDFDAMIAKNADLHDSLMKVIDEDDEPFKSEPGARGVRWTVDE